MATFHCGPLEIEVHSQYRTVKDKLAETLGLYDLDWRPPYRPIHVVATSGDPLPEVRGDFLGCARMLVDGTCDGLVATTHGGMASHGQFTPNGENWTFTVPGEVKERSEMADLEDLIGLVLTTGWRRSSWVPMHVAAVTTEKASFILCATSGGGKSTMTAALVARGWQTLGDDKLLLRLNSDGRPELAALLHTFNLHPRTREWLPEVGDLERLPAYSSWTDKRKVSVGDIWRGRVSLRTEPTHLIRLERRDDVDGVVVRELDRSELLPVLMRQTVIPTDREVARQILEVLAALSSHLEGFHVQVGTDAYKDAEGVAALEKALL